MQKIIDWLLSGPCWISYRTRKDLLDESPTSKAMLKLKQEMYNLPQIRDIIDDLKNWPGPVLKSHKNVDLHIHKLDFIAELGFKMEYPDIKGIIEKIITNQSSEGPFTILVNIPTHFGGSGRDQQAWMLCDASVILSALLQFGLVKDKWVNKAVNYLTGIIRQNGWPCAATASIAKFRGPGRKDDPCPYATLRMLKVLAYHPELKESEQAHIGTECLLALWQQRKERRPYLFAMGTDFKKLKAPLMWHDILAVADTLSHFHWVIKDNRFRQMVQIILDKEDNDGLYTAESIYRAAKCWEYGQKKKPSYWITFLVYRIKKRLAAV